MAKKSGPSTPDAEIKVVVRNKKARHRYEIVDTYEAGLVLKGTEVKSIRDGNCSIAEAHCRIYDGEVWIVDMDIAPYSHAGLRAQHDRKRRRKLLLNRQEINKLIGKIKEKGFTLIPLALYFKDGRAKVEIALGRGRKVWDKREQIEKKQSRRELRNMHRRR